MPALAGRRCAPNASCADSFALLVDGQRRAENATPQVNVPTRFCNPKLIERIVDTEKDWRKQAHGIVALAKVDPESARKRLLKIADQRSGCCHLFEIVQHQQ